MSSNTNLLCEPSGLCFNVHITQTKCNICNWNQVKRDCHATNFRLTAVTVWYWYLILNVFLTTVPHKHQRGGNNEGFLFVYFSIVMRYMQEVSKITMNWLEAIEGNITDHSVPHIAWSNNKHLILSWNMNHYHCILRKPQWQRELIKTICAW